MSIKWISTQDSLPIFGKRVLCWEKSTNLYGRNMEPVHVFLYHRTPSEVGGNNSVPYRWDCENGGFAFGQSVIYWAEIAGPNAQ